MSSGSSSSGRAAFHVKDTYAKSAPATGAHTLRRVKQELIAGSTAFQQVNYEYGSGSSIPDLLSRVASVTVGTSTPPTVASYEYLGASDLVATRLDQASVETAIYTESGGTHTYGDLDRFNRPTRWNWERTGAASFYDHAIGYDENSNPTYTKDDVHVRMSTGKHIFDVVYLLDGLNRVTAAGEGHRDGTGVIESGTATRNELWNSLSLTGNWGNRKLDVNGDGVFTGEDDRDERGNGDLHRERRGSGRDRRTTVNDVNSSACWAAIVWSSIQIVASVVGTGIAMLAAKAILAKLPGGDLDSAYFVVEPKQLFIVLGVVHCAVLVGVLIVLAVMQYVRQP